MKKCCVLLILLVFCSTFFVFSQAEEMTLGGSGTVDAPYQISSAADFYALGNIETSGKYFQLTKSLFLSGNTSIPVFTGVLDGQGHTIAGVTAPLFTELRGGQVSHLAVVNADGVQGGIIAKTMTAGVVSACLVEGKVVSGGMVAGEIDGSSRVEMVAAMGRIEGNNTGLFAGQNGGQVSNSYFAGYATGTVSPGAVNNCFYDRTLLGKSVSGVTGLSTQELIQNNLNGGFSVAAGSYPWPSSLKSQPFACLPIDIKDGDHLGHISQNMTLPSSFAGQAVTWTLDGQGINHQTDFAFPIDQAKMVMLTAQCGTQQKRFILSLDRVINITARTENGRAYSSGEKVNERVWISVSGADAIEYSTDGVTFIPYQGEFVVEAKTEVLFRYTGQSAVKRFWVDISMTPPVIEGVTDGHSGYLGKQVSFVGSATLRKDQGPAKNFHSGALITEPGTYQLTVTDAYGNESEISFTILSLWYGGTIEDLEMLRTQMEDEWLLAQDLPTAYLQEVQQKLIELQREIDRRYAEDFDAKIEVAVSDQEREALYFAYQLLTSEQRALLRQQTKYQQLIAELRAKRLTDTATGIQVIPLGELPIDVYIRVEKTKKGYRVWLEREGRVYVSHSGFTVKVPYADGYLTYLAGVQGAYEDGYYVFQTEQLGEIALEKDKTAVAAGTNAKEQQPPLNVTQLGGWIVVLFIVGSMLFRLRKVDME